MILGIWNIYIEIKLEKFSHTCKMVKLKDLEAYIKVRDYMEENSVTTEDMLGSLDRKFVQVTVDLNGVSKKFYSLYSAAKYMDVSLSTIRYSYSQKRDSIRKMKGEPKVFFVE